MTLPKEQQLEEVDVLFAEDEAEGHGLVVFNDDVNTFDHVIETLIKVCKHERVQAEQCTWIIHYKGKCEVKKGSFEILKPMKDGSSLIDSTSEITYNSRFS